MHRVMIMSMRGQLRLFVDGEQRSIGGQLDNVPDTEPSWRRMRDNINHAPDAFELTIVYDELKATLLNRCAQHFSDIAALRLIDVGHAFECMSAAQDKTTVHLGGYLITRGADGRLHYETTDEPGGDENFSPSALLDTLRQELKQARRNCSRAQNRAKSLQIQLEKLKRIS